MCILLQFLKIPFFKKRKAIVWISLPRLAGFAVSGHCGGDCGLGHLVDTCHQSTNCDLPRVAQALFEPAPGSVGAVSQLMRRASSKVLFAHFTITTNIGLVCMRLASQIQGECFDRLRISFYNFIYLFLAVRGLPCLEGFSVVSASGSYTSAAVHGLLTVVPSLVEQQL